MLLHRIGSQGHRSPPIQCCLTSDTLGAFTLSRTEAKLWNRHSAICLATLTWNEHHEEPNSSSLELDDIETRWPTRASTMVLVPGDRHLLVGFESGHLLLFDVLSKSVLQTISDAHQGGVRGLALCGDKKSFLSGGSDKRVNFYNFDLNLSESRFHSLCLVKARDPETVADQITCIAVSASNHLVGIGLVNFHVDVYLMDLFKRVHSLYGHAAPVTSLDISVDSRLLITGSSDKTVRLWELQFGNCQRRFTSHPEPVTCVRFIPHTSLAVSSDMSGLIKQWDVSKLREVTTLKGHHGGITCLSTAATDADFVTRRTKNGERRNLRKNASKVDISHEETDWEDSCGGLVVSSGLDFSIRLWLESDDLLILEEEAELAREAEEGEELVRSEAVIPGAIPAEISETGILGYPNHNTRDLADMLMEATDIFYEECGRLQLIADGKRAQPIHPLIAARCGDGSPERFLLSSLNALRASGTQFGGGGAGFEHALGAITTDHVRRLLPQLVDFLTRGWEVELVGRAIRHIVTLHFCLIVSSQPLRDVLEQSREARSHALGRLKGMMGMNLAGLEYLQRQIEDQEQYCLFKSIISKREHVRRRISKRNRLAMLIPG
ncbi:unnamed protein product [Dicrocoelium dendriticum]|nr:unnamed protein product [Dicrocoelium dendriticum]